IIVTGGAGFIGSALVWKLNSMGAEDIFIVDHLGKSEKWKNLRSLKFSDYAEKDKFREMITCDKMTGKKIETVFHLGACSSTTETDASYLMDNNYEYSKELAVFCSKRRIRFIYASSAATYGDGSNGWSDDEKSLAGLQPLNMYGYSKHAFDLWMRRNGLLKTCAGLKFTNVFGPNEWHKGDMRSLVCKAFDQILATGVLKLFKSHKKEFRDGEQKRDFLYVKDAVEMCVHAKEKRINGIYNIGSGRAETWNSLADAIFAALGKKNNIKYIDMPEEIRQKYQYYSCAEMKKLASAGYRRPATPLKDAVKEYVTKHLIGEKHLGE
ncbi:MAG TPA: ADP-glyceromanno-heptose 6-epimerase, partial [Victivallales bacterium]|nr:ADP-glyceromanno-heptose 6-epimerase [Victivallales bacterium]